MPSNYLPAVAVFQQEKPIYVRERDSGMYDIWVYATTKFFAEIPITLFVSFLFVLMTYFSIGFTDSISNFLSFYLVMFLLI